MSDAINPRVLNALLRNDFVSFIEKSFLTLAPATTFQRNWHIEAIAYHLELCLARKIRRLIITLPPRSLKSICASVAFPAWVLGHDPSHKLVCVSYSADLAGVHARDTREIMDSAWYRKTYPETRLSRRRSAELDFMTTRRGSRYATSVGGTLTGRGGSIIIIDDPMKAEDIHSEVMRNRNLQWYNETLITRLDDKRNDVIIIVMQRLHVDDLVGHVLQTGDWVHLNLPAVAQHDERILLGPDLYHYRKKGELLHPEREGQRELAELESALGSRAFAAQYLQEPIAPDGTIIHWSWFKFFDEMPSRQPDDEIIQSWDTAVKAGLANDYSVCTTWLVRDKTYYLLDLLRVRLEFPNLRRKAIEHADDWKADTVLIEDAASGSSLLQEMKRHRSGSTWVVEAVRPEVDKEQRAEAQAVPIEAGQVLLLRGAPWLEDLYREIRDFPRGHDDQVDSITQFLAWIRSRIVYARHLEVRWPYSSPGFARGSFTPRTSR